MVAPAPPPPRSVVPGLAGLLRRLLPVAPEAQAAFDVELAAHAQTTRDAVHRLEVAVQELLARTATLEARLAEVGEALAAGAAADERHDRELADLRTSAGRLVREGWDAVAVARRLAAVEDQLVAKGSDRARS